MKKILIQIDGDPQPSVFDRVVAVDAGADEIFSHGAVTPAQVQNIVHGAIFTRGPADLKNTAIFVGGSDVALGEQLMAEAQKHMLPKFGLRVSILLDANGANTTAAAAVLAARKHLDLKNTRAIVLGGTGPVGQRVARLLAKEGAAVRVGSRQATRAAAVCQKIESMVPGARLEPVGTSNAADLPAILKDQTLVVAAGAAGVVLLPKDARTGSKTLKVAIDLNAVPPLGIEGVDATDKAKERDGVIAYGALGVGGTKMKIHKAAIAKLFESNDQVMDAEEVYALGLTL
ncbi:MAG: NAD(P)-dependent methylenetetrahydromethanopterin dehydrogenase [Gemmataceae bacterium]